MNGIIKNLMNAARHFSVMDFAAMKLYLLCFGILLGSYFSDFFLEHIGLVWIVLILALVALILRTSSLYKK
jgi:hypothetical protein